MTTSVTIGNLAILDLAVYKSGGDITWVGEIRNALDTMMVNYTHYRTNYYNLWPGVDKITGKTVGDLYDALSHEFDVVLQPDVYSQNPRVDQSDMIPRLTADGVTTIAGLHLNTGVNREPGADDRALQTLRGSSRPFVTRRAMYSISGCDDIAVRSVELPYLPYHLKLTSVSKEHHQRGVIITSRITGQKGQLQLAKMARHIDGDVTIAGRAQSAAARAIRDRLVKDGMVKRWHVEPDTTWSCRWDAKLVTGHHFRYVGAFEKPWEIPWHMANVHVNLTAEGYSSGHLEYATLEAIDAGLTALVPVHAIEGLGYESVVGLPYRTMKDYDADEICDLINRALHAPISVADHEATYRDLAKHDPVTYVQRLLDDGRTSSH